MGEAATVEVSWSRRHRAATVLLALVAVSWIVGGVVVLAQLRGNTPAGLAPPSWWGLTYPIFGAGVMAVAAWGSRRRTTGWQLVTRILVAGQLFLPFVQMGLEPYADPSLAALATVLALALALMGREGLEPDDGPFQPRRLRPLLVLMIVAAGVLSYSIFGVLVERLGIWASRPEFAGDFRVAPYVYATGYALTALGLYRMRAIVLLIPLAIAAHMTYVQLVVVPEQVRGLAGGHALREQFFWGRLRWGALVAFLFVPFAAALVWLRVQARRGQRSSGPEA